MTDRPIIFGAPMVRAILDGRKTVTRRLVKDAGGAFWDHAGYRPTVVNGRVRWHCVDTGADAGPGAPMPRSPYGGPGDRLWVRETFAERVDIDGRDPAQRDRAKHYLMFKANGDDPRDPDNFHTWGAWKPSIHMPRWASRITLDVVSVRVERLHEITEEDARAEGIESLAFVHDATSPDDGFLGHVFGRDDGRSTMYHTAREAFAGLWDSLNAERAPWASNPWVWRVEFRRAVQP